MNSIKLSNGVLIPKIGFGTAAIGKFKQDNAYVEGVVTDAINSGYRHIDTASLYGNERSIGKAIKKSNIDRHDFFITSKVWDTDQGYKNTLKSFDNSLDRLGLNYLDLYLIHWPYEEKTKETWQALERLYEDKRVRAIGVSNFRISDLEDIKSFAKYMPVVNQVELHPYLTQESVIKYCAQNNIIVFCWSPLGTGSWSGVELAYKPISDDTIRKISEQHGVSPAQVILKWNTQQGRIVIPKSETHANIINNSQLDNFTLSEGEIREINVLNKSLRFGGDPDNSTASNLQQIVPA